MKVTYLLGAGASYKAIPIIGELNNAFLEINSKCENNVTNFESNEITKAKALFDSHMKTGAKAAKTFGTIDTYAKKLSLTNNNDLQKVKAALALFFTIWQDIDKSQLNKREKATEYFQDIDDRYFGLIANYLEKVNDKVILNENVSFITWNYDTQLERAISEFLDISLEQVLEDFAVYPWNIKNNPKINHLNGIAGLYKNNTDNTIKTLFGKTKENNFKKVFLNHLPFINDVEALKLENTNYFTYAWEKDHVSESAIKRAADTIKETNVLVIIGYSFPTFNDSVDKVLFESLRQSENFNTVYYQDPNASAELLNARFGISEEKIKIINKNMDQFILPLDSHAIAENKVLKDNGPILD